MVFLLFTAGEPCWMPKCNCSGVAAAVVALTRVNPSPPRLTDAPARFCNATNPNFYEFSPAPRSPVARFREEVLFFVRQPGTIFKGSAEFYCVGCVITVEVDWTTGAVQVRWRDTFTVNLRWLSSSSLSSFLCFHFELQVVVIASCEHAYQRKYV